MSRRIIVAVVALLVAAAPARAQLDPEPRTPYLWQVVLKAQPHPLLTGAFRVQLKRDIVAALAPALGSLGTVEVVDLADVPRDQWQPLWQQFDDKGFPALDATRDLTSAKTHFLTLEYQDGQYHLESRQHDGFTGLASPVVRRENVRAPELVGRTAGLMLDRDFGLAGTVEPGPRDEAKVILRAGQLGRVDRFVKAGDIFAVSEVKKTNRPAPPPVRTATGKIIAPPSGSAPPPGLSAQPRSFTLLRVTEVGGDGVLKCAVLTRWKTALPAKPGTAGYRCLKLGTIEQPLVVRLVSSSGALQKSAGQVRVRATETGFKAPDEPRDYFEFKSGLYHSPRPFANVACVVVSLVGGEAQQYPVPILGTEPVNLQFETSLQAAQAAEFVRTALNARDRLDDALNAQSICFEATAKLIDKQKNEEALARAKGGYQAADTADKSITDDLTQLKEQVGLSPDGPKLVAAIERKLLAMREINGKLKQHIAKWEEVVRREKDPTIGARQVQAEALAERIKLLLGRGDVDEAINAYDQLVTLANEGDEAAKVREARDKLKADWKPKSPAHAKARDYLLKTWPGVATIPDFKDSLPQIGAAVDECMKAGDRYTLRKLLSIFTGSIVKLKELTEPLDQNADADRKLASQARDVGEAMAALEARIQKFVKGE
jgi:tetratricopeptide (TPR) repeat protein